MAAPKLRDLHSALIAASSGYAEALDKSEDTSIRALCQAVLEMRSRHHEQLHGALKRLGEQVEEDAPFMATVQKVVIDVRAAITGIDKDALPSFIRGEEAIIEKYDDAMQDVSGDAPAADTLQKQKMEVEAKIAEMKTMAPD